MYGQNFHASEYMRIMRVVYGGQNSLVRIWMGEETIRLGLCVRKLSGVNFQRVENSRNH